MKNTHQLYSIEFYNTYTYDLETKLTNKERKKEPHFYGTHYSNSKNCNNLHSTRKHIETYYKHVIIMISMEEFHSVFFFLSSILFGQFFHAVTNVTEYNECVHWWSTCNLVMKRNTMRIVSKYLHKITIHFY